MFFHVFVMLVPCQTQVNFKKLDSQVMAVLVAKYNVLLSTLIYLTSEKCLSDDLLFETLSLISEILYS